MDNLPRSSAIGVAFAFKRDIAWELTGRERAEIQDGWDEIAMGSGFGTDGAELYVTDGPYAADNLQCLLESLQQAWWFPQYVENCRAFLIARPIDLTPNTSLDRLLAAWGSATRSWDIQ
jgi:hypothetical protein